MRKSWREDRMPGQWPLFWNLWKAKHAQHHGPSTSYQEFRHRWKVALNSGDWSVFQKLASDFAAMSEGQRSRLLGKKYRLFSSSFWRDFGAVEEAAHKASEPQEEEKRWGDEGFWEDFGRQYREAEERERRDHTSTPRSSCVSSRHHRVLGVRPSATREEIRSAYRKLAMQHHPDHGGTVEKMREINAAYDAIVG